MSDTSSSVQISDAIREKLDKKLKRFPEEVKTEVIAYMEGDSTRFMHLLNQIMIRFAEKPSLLENPTPELKLNEEVGIDSLSVVELSLLVELIFNVSSDEFIEALSESEESITYGDVLKLCRTHKVPGSVEACAQLGI